VTGYKRRPRQHQHDFKTVRPNLYSSIWIDQAHWFDEPWVYVGLILGLLCLAALACWLVYGGAYG
jgi:hypothetical protein